MDSYINQGQDLDSHSSLRVPLPESTNNISNDNMTSLSTNISVIAPQNFIELFRLYTNFTLVAIGLVCNTLSLIVFLSTRLKKTTFGHYLVALAIADNLVLIGEVVISLGNSAIGINVIHESNVICKLTYCVRYAARLWSAILVTVITIERYYFIVHPLKMTHLHTTFAAKLLILTTFWISCLLSLYAVFLVHVDKLSVPSRHRCVIRNDSRIAFSICDLVVSRVLADVITGILILTFTIFIACHLVKVNKTRKALQVHIHPPSPQRELQVTLMLLMVAVTFIILKVPYTVSWYWRFYIRSINPPRHSRSLDVATSLTNILSVMTYSINFFLYSVCGSSFREALRCVVLCQTMSATPRNHNSSENGGRLSRHGSKTHHTSITTYHSAVSATHSINIMSNSLHIPHNAVTAV